MTRFALLAVGLVGAVGVGLRGQPAADATKKMPDDPGALPVVAKKFADAAHAKLPAGKVKCRFRSGEGYALAARAVLYAVAGVLQKDHARELEVSPGLTGGPTDADVVVEFLTKEGENQWLALRHTFDRASVGNDRRHAFTWTSSGWADPVGTADGRAVADVLGVSVVEDAGGTTFVTKGAAAPEPKKGEPPPPFTLPEPLACDKMRVSVHLFQGEERRTSPVALKAMQVKYPGKTASCLQWVCTDLTVGKRYYLELDHDYPFPVVAYVYVDGRPSTGEARDTLKDAPYLVPPKAPGAGAKDTVAVWGWANKVAGEKKIGHQEFKVAAMLPGATKVNGFPKAEEISTIQVKWHPAWRGKERPKDLPGGGALNGITYTERDREFEAAGKIETGWDWDTRELGSVTIVYGTLADKVCELKVALTPP